MSIARAQDGITLSWTNEAPVMVAEQSLALGLAWAALTNAPALTPSNTWTVAVPLEQGVRFFRLRLQ